MEQQYKVVETTTSRQLCRKYIITHVWGKLAGEVQLAPVVQREFLVRFQWLQWGEVLFALFLHILKHQYLRYSWDQKKILIGAV